MEVKRDSNHVVELVIAGVQKGLTCNVYVDKLALLVSARGLIYHDNNESLNLQHLIAGFQLEGEHNPEDGKS